MDWLDEIDLDPATSWLRMGTRALGDRPWLVVDDARDAELALKADLLTSRRDEVLAIVGDVMVPAGRTLDLVRSEGFDIEGLAGAGEIAGRHPLEVAGRAVQEDLCLLERRTEGWILVAGVVCFPSRWRLRDKIGLPLGAVHGPVVGYDPVLVNRVDGLLDRLDERIVWRRNWFIHPDPSLFQPDRPPDGDPVVAGERCGADLHLRSERQTLRRLGGPFALFTIKIDQAPLDRFVADPDRRRGLARFVAEAEADDATHRGIGEAQRRELDRWLGR